MTSRGAFSLTELLVVLGVLAIVAAISLPALRDAKTTSEETVALADLRSNSQLFAVYSSHSSGEYPIGAQSDACVTGTDDGVEISASSGSTRIVICTRWFGQSSYWHLLLLRAGIDARDSAGLDPQNWGSVSKYRYAECFVARPAYWRTTSDQAKELLGAIREYEVESPSRKGLMHLGTTSLRSPVPICFVDGHASQHPLNEATQPVVNSRTNNAIPVHNTQDGVMGYDY